MGANNKKVTPPKKEKTQFRYRDEDHYKLVHQAVEKAGLSLNAWLVQATLRQARLEVGS